MSKLAAVIGVVTGFVAALTGFVVLSLYGVDTTPLVLFVGGAATSLVPQLMTLIKQEALHKDMEVVKERTNGPVTAIAENVKANVEAVQANVDTQSEIIDRLVRMETLFIEHIRGEEK